MVSLLVAGYDRIWVTPNIQLGRVIKVFVSSFRLFILVCFCPMSIAQHILDLTLGYLAEQDSDIELAGKNNASNCVDGNVESDEMKHSCCGFNRYWKVDLSKNYQIESIEIYKSLQQPDNLTANVLVEVSKDLSRLQPCNYNAQNNDNFVRFACNSSVNGRYIILYPEKKNQKIHFCEIKVRIKAEVCHPTEDQFFYGIECDRECHCEDQCNFVTGECSSKCETGYDGKICTMCTRDKWGDYCMQSCSSECPTSCHVTSGVCLTQLSLETPSTAPNVTTDLTITSSFKPQRVDFVAVIYIICLTGILICISMLLTYCFRKINNATYASTGVQTYINEPRNDVTHTYDELKPPFGSIYLKSPSTGYEDMRGIHKYENTNECIDTYM